MAEFIELEATIDLSRWDASIAAMLGDAERVQTALTGFVVTLDVDSDLSSAESALSDLETIAPEITIGANVDEMAADVDAEITTIESTDPEVIVGADVESMTADVDAGITTIESTDPEVAVGGDPEPMVTEVGDAVLAFDDLAPEIPVTGETQDIATDIASIKQSLDTVKKLAIVDFIFNIPESFNKFVDTITNLPGIGFLVEADEMLSHIAARTGEAVPGLEDVINALRIESGDTQAIESALTFLIQNGETASDALKNVSELGLDFVDVWGGDVVQTLATAQQLVDSGLVPSIDDAFNAMTLGMQSGANAQGDFLAFLEKGAANFVELGFSAQDAVALAAGAIDAGVPDLQRYGQMFLGLRKDLAAGGEETQAMLEKLHIDPDDIGIEGYTAILDYLAQIEDQAVQTQAITDTFGSRAQGLTAPQVLAPPDMEVLSKDMDNLAADTGDTFEHNITDSLNKAVDSFQVELVSALDDALNISGFIDKITGAATTFSQSIKEGMTIGQALEVSLALPEGSFSSFESAVGNFAIGVLEMVAGIQEFFGHADVAQTTRGTIARMATTQLAFDLQVANPDELGGIIMTAIDRGVSDSNIQAALEAGVQDLVDAGKLDEAAALLAEIQESQTGLSDTAQNLIEQYGGINEAIEAFSGTQVQVFGSREEMEAQLAAVEELKGALSLHDVDTAAIQAPIDKENQVIADQAAVLEEANKMFLDSVATNFDTAVVSMQTSEDALASSTAAWQKEVSDMVISTVTDSSTLATDAKANIDLFTSGILAMSGALMDTVVNLAGPLSDFAAQLGGFVDVGTQAITVGGQIGAQGGVVPSDTTFGASGGSFAPGAHVFGEHGAEFGFTDERMAVLNNRTTEAMMAGMAMGGGTTVNIYNTFNPASAAASIGGIGVINNQLRGFMQ